MRVYRLGDAGRSEAESLATREFMAADWNSFTFSALRGFDVVLRRA
jgi:hypothetical protein